MEKCAIIRVMNEVHMNIDQTTLDKLAIIDQKPCNTAKAAAKQADLILNVLMNAGYSFATIREYLQNRINAKTGK